MTPAEILTMIDGFEEKAFSTHFANLRLRKRALELHISSCPDLNVKYILGIAIGYLSQHPDWVRAEIHKARGAVRRTAVN